MAADIFLKIEGISGESQDALHEGEIDIASWNWKVQQDARYFSGSGGGSPKATANDLEVVHAVDRASPGLMSACFLGRRFSKAVLTLRKSGGGAPLDFFKITMDDVLVTSVTPFSSWDTHFEQVSLSFSKIKQEYLIQHETGIGAGMVVAAFDIKNNKQA
jgi:type VI secretion system secreted protein Hcp